ncbi:MAG: TlpA disulfide reductase family protein [Leptospirillum sp.]|nr:redoxin domain-containing protein [Nitrospiraceae bacterium]
METLKKYWPQATAVFLILLVLGYYGTTYRFAPLKVGMVAPDFDLESADGKRIKLSDYRGKVVMLNFWATWCKPCKQEMPSMEIMYEGMKEQAGSHFELLAVNENNVFYKNQVAPFLEKHNIHFPVPLDPLNTLDHRYKITGVPETFVIDQNGVVAEHVVGPRNWVVKKNLDSMLTLLDKGPQKPEEYIARKAAQHPPMAKSGGY